MGQSWSAACGSGPKFEVGGHEPYCYDNSVASSTSARQSIIIASFFSVSRTNPSLICLFGYWSGEIFEWGFHLRPGSGALPASECLWPHLPTMLSQYLSWCS